MTISIHYYQSCPSCSRSLCVEKQWSGQVVRCSHCAMEFRTCPSGVNKITEVRIGRSANPTIGGGADSKKVRDAKLVSQSVLLVDGDRAVLDSFAAALNRCNMIVTAVHHPRMALAAVRIHPYAVAILDNNLSEMNGIELMKSLIGYLPELRVIILCGSSDTGLRRRAKEAGAFAYLEKPCRLDVLRTTVANAIRADRQIPNGRNIKRIAHIVRRIESADCRKVSQQTQSCTTVSSAVILISREG